MAHPRVLERVRKEIIDAGRDRRYKLQAYGFVMAGLDYFRTKLGERRHVTGQELTRTLVEFAEKQFGPLSRAVLKDWGIQETADFGYVVYNLIDIQVLRKQKSDSVTDFFDVLDLEQHFSSRNYYTIDPASVKSVRGA